MTPEQRAAIQAAVDGMAEVDRLSALMLYQADHGAAYHQVVMRHARAARDALAKLLEDGDG